VEDDRRHETPARRVDEGYLEDWVRYGMLELALYLERQAQFAAWCEQREEAQPAQQ
jgi:hypothetical protein